MTVFLILISESGSDSKNLLQQVANNFFYVFGLFLFMSSLVCIRQAVQDKSRTTSLVLGEYKSTPYYNL
jgi:hypothetical protein